MAVNVTITSGLSNSAKPQDLCMFFFSVPVVPDTKTGDPGAAPIPRSSPGDPSAVLFLDILSRVLSKSAADPPTFGLDRRERDPASDLPGWEAKDKREGGSFAIGEASGLWSFLLLLTSISL
eukprot:Hpha_TRINITY_DN4484_c0_g1::TRINITY_DN4484_c0_g1_i1::g.50444::m.50444